MNDPERPATMLMPSAMPRSSAGNASVRMAAEFDMSIAPPTACTMRKMMMCSAAEAPEPHVSESATAASVKTTKPALYMRTRPYMSPRRPKRTTSTAVASP